MKTLVYRHNPLIHISAPEIKEADFAGNINYVIETNGEPFNLHFHKEDWALLEETPEMSRLTWYVYRTLKFVNESNISNEKLKDSAPYFASCFRGIVMEDIENESISK